MSALPYADRKQVKSIDWLFAQLPGETSGSGLFQVPPVAPPQAGAVAQAASLSQPAASEAPAYTGPSLPPLLDNPADLRAAYEWLQTEKNRLEEYTRSQFAKIHQQHQALLAKHMQSEQTLAVRAQEVNQEIHFLTTQAEALRKRGQELTAREQALARQMEELAKAQTDLLVIQQTSQDVKKDTEAQRAVLNTLREETARLQGIEAAARGQFESLESALRVRQQAWEQKQAEITARQAQIDKRYITVEKAEEAVRTRLQELCEYEERLRRELEEQGKKLAEERHEFETMRADFRLRRLHDERNRGGSSVALGELE